MILPNELPCSVNIQFAIKNHESGGSLQQWTSISAELGREHGKNNCLEAKDVECLWPVTRIKKLRSTSMVFNGKWNGDAVWLIILENQVKSSSSEHNQVSKFTEIGYFHFQNLGQFANEASNFT